MPFSKLENKTGKHKDWYSPEYVRILCSVINPNDTRFSSKALCRDYKRVCDDLELKARLTRIAELLDESLECSFQEKLEVLSGVFGPPLESESGVFTEGFYIYPISQFVELFGERDLEASLSCIYEMTQRFTGEWAVRTIANSDEKLTMKCVKRWSKDENFHVRRLASEGLRPRLPWGKKIVWVDESPEKLIPIYTRLRNDKVLYVRRSVANSMGDIIKLDSELAFETFENWLGEKLTIENLWVIKHAIRTPVKKGDRQYTGLQNTVKGLMSDIKRANASSIRR